ncbi:hypothetical protein ACE3MQ_19290 [Paenibacillus lentus]|uniref:hypothetical protein n=1 Tax=Paenibacillus lentus TaxID=1338368 RepID=UPI0036515250
MPNTYGIQSDLFHINKLIIFLIILITISGCKDNSVTGNQNVEGATTVTANNATEQDKEIHEDMNQVIDHSLNRRTIINPAAVEIGQSIGGLTVLELDTSGTGTDLQVNDITFSGELTLTGAYEWDDTGDGFGYIITLDEEMMERIPLFEDFADERTLILGNTEEAAELLSSSSGKATFVLANYSIGYRQIMISADLVKVME